MKQPGQRSIHIDVGDCLALCGTSPAFVGLSSDNGTVCQRCQARLVKLHEEHMRRDWLNSSDFCPLVSALSSAETRSVHAENATGRRGTVTAHKALRQARARLFRLVFNRAPTDREHEAMDPDGKPPEVQMDEKLGNKPGEVS